MVDDRVLFLGSSLAKISWAIFTAFVAEKANDKPFFKIQIELKRQMMLDKFQKLLKKKDKNTQFMSLNMEALEERQMMSGSPVELAQIEIGTVFIDDSEFVDVDGVAFFAANDGVHGPELWKSDGTKAGTQLVRDIATGIGGSQISNLTNVDGTLFFGADNGTNGFELWKSDGTESGTVLVKDIVEGTADSLDDIEKNSFANVDGTLFFSATDGDSGFELWKSDGTEAGTVLVKDIAEGSSSSFVRDLTNFDGTLFFSAFDENSGRELWKSDGTEDGTVLVKDIGTFPSFPKELININETLFFVAEDDETGRELWKSDGTEDGTVLVKDINSQNGESSFPSELTNVNGTLFFSATEDNQAVGIWKSDGTESGTIFVRENPADTFRPDNLTNVNGTLFFSIEAKSNRTGQLWKSDGTENGTVLVEEFQQDFFDDLGQFTSVNGILFFSATPIPSLGDQLMKSDGTTEGTVVVQPNLTGTNTVATAGGNVFFNANNGNGEESLQVIRGDYQSFAAPYGFEDISETGELILANIDGDTETLTSSDLGDFTFEFYGETLDELHINLNGLITFDAPFNFDNDEISGLDGPAVAAFWDSLTNEGGNGAGAAFWEVRGVGDDQRLIVQWQDTSFDQSSTDLMTFQAILFANGKIRLNYSDIKGGNVKRDFGKTATIGVKQRDGQFSEANIVHSNEISGRIESNKSVIIDQSTLADEHGYRGRTEKSQFVELSTNAIQILDGENNAAVELGQEELPGFNFEFYGTTYESLFVSSNGLITFGEENTSSNNTDFSTGIDQAAIAVLWDALDNTQPESEILFELSGDKGFQQLVVQWSVDHQNSGGFLKFQVILDEADNSVRVNYEDLELDAAERSNAGSATIGIKDAGNDQSRMQLYSFNDNLMVESDSSIRFVDDNVFAIKAGSGNNTFVDLKNNHVEMISNGNKSFVYNGTNDIRVFDDEDDGSDILDMDGTNLDEIVTFQKNKVVYESGDRRIVVNDFEQMNVLTKLGNDQVKIVGTEADEAVTFRDFRALFDGEDYDVAVNNAEDINVVSGGGEDTATFFGTDGDEVLFGKQVSTLMVGNGFKNRASGFQDVTANAGDGDDTSHVFDTAGNDFFTADPNEATMANVDETYSVKSVGFDRVIARAVNGGNEQAFFTGSRDGDRFTGRENFGLLKGLDGDYLLRANGFNRVVAEGNGGDDVANLFDSAGDDTFRGEEVKSFLKGTGFFNTAKDFDRVNAKATNGDDTATLIDSAGDDTFLGKGKRGILRGENNSFINFTTGFDTVRGDAANGGTDDLNVKPNITYTFVELGDWET